MTEKMSFVFGEESFLVDEHIQRVRRHCSHQSMDYFPEKCDWNEAFLMISSISLFDASKCISWKNPWFLSASLTPKDMDHLKSLIDAVNQSDHTLIIYTSQKVDQRKKGVSFLKKNTASFEYSSFKDWEQDKMIDWLRDRINRLSLSIDDQALYALVELGGKNLRHLAGEIDKLIVYMGDQTHITLQAILSICSGVNTGIYKFNEAMKISDFKTVMKELSHLLDHGEDPIKLFGLFTSNIRFYFQILSLCTTASFQEIGKALGKNPYFIKRLIPSIQKYYTHEQCIKAFHILAQKDKEIKSGKLAPRAALEMAVLNVYC